MKKIRLEELPEDLIADSIWREFDTLFTDCLMKITW